MIRFDSTPYDVLAVCTGCGSWRHHALTQDGAELAARAHLETCLPAIPDPAERKRALAAQRQRRQYRRNRDTP